jgi:hypothetical protein
MKCIISIGVAKAEWRAGEMQSTPIGTPRAAAISGDTLGPGNTPPCPGLAPCDSLISSEMQSPGGYTPGLVMMAAAPSHGTNPTRADISGGQTTTVVKTANDAMVSVIVV